MIIALSIVAYFVFGWLTLVADKVFEGTIVDYPVSDRLALLYMFLWWPIFWGAVLILALCRLLFDSAESASTWLKNRKEPNDPK